MRILPSLVGGVTAVYVDKNAALNLADDGEKPVVAAMGEGGPATIAMSRTGMWPFTPWNSDEKEAPKTTEQTSEVKCHAIEKDHPYHMTLENFQNTQYLGSFWMGYKWMQAIYDTGSFDTLVLSTDCVQSGSCPKSKEVQLFNQNQSKHFHWSQNHTKVMHSFGSGPAVSMQGFDTLWLSDDVCAEEQPVWIMEQHEIPVMNLPDTKFVAIIGIGPFSHTDTGKRTLLNNLHVREFDICLPRARVAEGHSQLMDGRMTWGHDPANHPDKFMSIPVNGNLHWQVALTDFGIGDEGSNLCEDCVAVLDSGTSLIAAPRHMLTLLGTEMAIQGIHIDPDCKNFDELPPLKLKLGDHHILLPAESYVMRLSGLKPAQDNILDMLSSLNPQFVHMDVCSPAFMPIDLETKEGQPMVILGMPFFRFYKTVFNRTEPGKPKFMHIAKVDDECNVIEEDADGQSLEDAVHAEHNEPVEQTVVPPLRGDTLPEGETTKTTMPDLKEAVERARELKKQLDEVHERWKQAAEEVKAANGGKDFLFKEERKVLSAFEATHKVTRAQQSTRYKATQDLFFKSETSSRTPMAVNAGLLQMPFWAQKAVSEHKGVVDDSRAAFDQDHE